MRHQNPEPAVNGTKIWSALYSIDNEVIDQKVLSRKNKAKSWAYGYNEDYDVIVISRDGTIGDIYLINSLKIALPKSPKSIDYEHDKWVPHQEPKELTRIKTMFDFKNMDYEFKVKHVDHINREFDRRDQGFWFKNKGKKTYMTGSHYMYLQHTKIDVGKPDFREANRIFYIFWEACKADNRCFGMMYLKIRRSGFSFMGSSESVNIATSAKDSRIGMLSKSGADAKKLFTDKVVPISLNYPFYFKPLQAGMDRPKTEILYSIPASKITKKNIRNSVDEDLEGLDTSIDWKSTDDNSYDGEKLLLLLHDESSKWIKPLSIKNNWRVTKTCLRLGSKIVGKCLMGSTCNALAKGGQNYKDLYEDSNPANRSKNGQTKSGMYSLFIAMEHNFEGYMDEYGHPVFETPKVPVIGVDGQKISMGVIEYWNNEVEAYSKDTGALNEFYRQFPRTEAHAFRDESKACLFDLTKLYQQIDYNDGALVKEHVLTVGSFHWKNGEKDTEVVWTPDLRGRFTLSWIPPKNLQNNVLKKNGKFYPKNSEIGSFGCDPYDISATVDGRGSNGALHGQTKFSLSENIPSSKFFLEYIARPYTAEIFFEEVLMACVFFGMPMLAENNKARLLYHFKNRGYRAFCLDRPDKARANLSRTEKELGGMPNNSEDVKQIHADCIDSYIKQNVGYDKEGIYRESDQCGDMYFNKTISDWAKFDINNWTKHDASISSGLALMANKRHDLMPKKEVSEISFTFARYDNSGNRSKIIR